MRHFNSYLQTRPTISTSPHEDRRLYNAPHPSFKLTNQGLLEIKDVKCCVDAGSATGVKKEPIIISTVQLQNLRTSVTCSKYSCDTIHKPVNTTTSTTGYECRKFTFRKRYQDNISGKCTPTIPESRQPFMPIAAAL